MKKEELQKHLDSLLEKRRKILTSKSAKPSEITDKLNKVAKEIESTRNKMEKL